MHTPHTHSSKPEPFAGLSADAQNKQRAARWSSLLLGVSLRAGARASVGGGGGMSWGFSDDGTAINIRHQCAVLLHPHFGSCRQAVRYQGCCCNQPNAQGTGALLHRTHSNEWLLLTCMPDDIRPSYSDVTLSDLSIVTCYVAAHE